jgi:Domain of unknown function (DUF4340)
MQERKNKRLIVSMIAMIVAIVALWFFAFRENSIELDQATFAVPQLETIDRVEMESVRAKVVLRFDGTRWMVNDQYPADRRSVTVMFGAVEHVRPRRPVSDKKKEEIVQALQKSGTTVRFFAKDNLMKEYVVGGIASRPEAWFQVPGSDPLIVNIPGYRVYASAVFEQTVGDWRDKLVFNLSPRTFKSLTTTFTKDPSEAFTITRNGNLFAVEGLPSDTSKVNTYLDDVSLLIGESFYAGGKPRIDSLLQGPTSFEVVLTDIGDRSFKLEVFPPLRNEANVYGRVRGEIMVFKRPEMVRIAKKKSWFRGVSE